MRSDRSKGFASRFAAYTAATEKIVESAVLEQAMGLWSVMGVGESGGKLEQRGRRPSKRLAKKRVRNLWRSGRLILNDKGRFVFVMSDDARDFAAVRALLKGYNRGRRQAWAGLSDEERTEARVRETWAMGARVASVTLPGALLKLGVLAAERHQASPEAAP